MRRALKIVGVLLLVLAALPALLIGVLNTGPGQDGVGRLAGWATGGQVQLAGLSGRFPDRLRIARLELRDADGPWLSVADAALDWHPLALLQRRAHVGLLAAERVTVARLPKSSAPAAPSTEPFTLPLPVELDKLAVAHLDLGQPVAGVAASLALDGSARLESLAIGQLDLALRRLDGPGEYRLAGTIDAQRLSAALNAAEPANGLVSRLAGLPDLGALSLAARLDGPWNAAALQLRLSGGELRATADGTLDLNAQAADLAITASAPAMTPRPDVSWQSIGVDAHVKGSLAAPTGTGTLRIAGLSAGGAALTQVALDLSADRGAADLRAVLTGLSLPGAAVFAAAPVVLAAHADLAAMQATGTLAHPLLDSAFTLRRDGVSNIRLTVPELKPFAALGGVAVAGRAELEAALARNGDTSTADATLRLGLTEAPPPALAALGPSPQLAASASLHGSDVTLRRLQLDGATLGLSAKASLLANVLDADWTLDLRDIAAAAPNLAGALRIQGKAAGPLDHLAAKADIAGTLGLRGATPAPLTAALRAEDLPAAPRVSISAQGTLGGDRLALEATGARDADGAMRLEVTQGDWKSAHLAAKLAMAAGATLPTGSASLRMGELGELAPLIGQRLAGSIEAQAMFDPAEANITLRGERLGLPGTASAARLNLTARLRNPAAPVVEAKLLVDGIAASGATGAAVRLDAEGPLDALALKLDATGPDIRTTMAARLDAKASRLAIAAFDGAWKGEHLVLAAPATLSFAEAIAVDRLRLRLREASLDIAGRMFPTLDLTVALRDLPARLAALAAPALDMAGSLRADARLTGKPAAPDGTLRLEAAGLKLRTGPGASLPAAQVSFNAKLGGGTTTLDGNASLGASRLGLSGTVVQNSALNLRATGEVDLALLDPLLAPDGRRARGRVSLDASITGQAADPRVAGAVTLARGEVQDLGQGIRISDIAARITGQGDRVVLENLTGRAGAGSIGARGSVGLAGAMPLELALTARNASPIQSELVTTAIDADLALSGALSGDKRASGTIRLRRTEIRIPEKLPAQVAVLNIRRPGQSATAAPLPPAPDIALDIAVEAPGQIFVRGRGLNAELGGSLRVRGTAAQPKPDGVFKLRRGDFSLIGKTLTFTQGAVGFDGRVPIDPTLDFAASSANSAVTATLAIGGYASQPKITLSSVPSLPQDEVLAQLLFNKSATTLGPVELAQIAAALAQIAGVGPGGGGTLDAIRSKLGLDRLAVGGGGASGATVEAGRTVAEGVYVGARQSTSGTGTQATVEIDIAKGLKLQADIGQSSGSSATGASGAGGTGVGLKYEFEY